MERAHVFGDQAAEVDDSVLQESIFYQLAWLLKRKIIALGHAPTTPDSSKSFSLYWLHYCEFSEGTTATLCSGTSPNSAIHLGQRIASNENGGNSDQTHKLFDGLEEMRGLSMALSATAIDAITIVAGHALCFAGVAQRVARLLIIVPPLWTIYRMMSTVLRFPLLAAQLDMELASLDSALTVVGGHQLGVICWTMAVLAAANVVLYWFSL